MRRPECGLLQRWDGLAAKRHRGSRLFGGDFYNISQVPRTMQDVFLQVRSGVFRTTNRRRAGGPYPQSA